ncbi:MAG: hypothetical protein CL677_05910 [Bdellovibrionaceae bacterium]|nr:hypothetical protein [Pseudobdellovibrionaceae bacterium]|tara:strand:+ start:141178 stop:142758 length:1581 start_codon:yes stop_codon:yes gene_type:complete
MSRTLHNISVELNEDLSEKLKWMFPEHVDFQILKESVDARSRKKAPHFNYSVQLFDKGEDPSPPIINPTKLNYSGPPLLIVGAGPAGLFAALRAVERGIPCHIFERGSRAEERIKKINKFWRKGELSPNDNVCFGEGGAGLYSDGKLITRIKSPHIPYVLQRLVQFGAPPEIEYLSNPHVGSDRLRRVIVPLRKRIEELGGQFHFNSPVVEFISSNKQMEGLITEKGETFRSPHILLATGHSANDIFEVLERHDVFMEPKDFAMGLRVEHKQQWVNKKQYKQAWDHPKLGAANYKLAHTDKSSGIGVYSFCMCPGGYVLSSGTESDGLVCNGMSNYRRNSPFANSALVVSVKHSSNAPLMHGMEMRRALEKSAYESVQNAGGTKQLPAQRLTDFLEGKLGPMEKTSSPSGVVPVRLDELLPESITRNLAAGIAKFEEKMNGFICSEATLIGVESRTSCPIRITRNSESFQSISHQGLYPLGEGAGYAGGITSAACDGIRVVDKIIESLATTSEQDLPTLSTHVESP